MKITFLGQAGLLFEANNMKIIIDPYLSNSVESINPNNYRRQEINADFLKIQPDVLILTHNHLDHYDEDTVKHYLNIDSSVVVLSPESVWRQVKKFGGHNNYIIFNSGTTVSEKDFVFKAVRAEHSDKYAIGVIINHNDKNYYVTGDTLYNEQIFNFLPNKIDVVFLPINGVGNNMNFMDAKKFVERINAKKVVPLHFGMFDDMTGIELEVKNKIIPQIYKEIKL